MQQRTKIAEAEKFKLAKQLENDEQIDQAIKSYTDIIKKNPLHIEATTRLLILYRKTKALIAEQALLNDSISYHKKHLEKQQQEWLKTHQKIAEDSRPLAKMLGLINNEQVPLIEHELIKKWKYRLEMLKKRIAKNKLLAQRKKPVKSSKITKAK